MFIQVCPRPGNSHTWHIRHLSQGWYDICIFIPLPPFFKTFLPSTIPLFQNSSEGRRSTRIIIGTSREAHWNPAVCLCRVLCYFMQLLFLKKKIFIYLVLSILSCGTQDLCCVTWDLSWYHTNSLVEVCGLSSSSACEISVPRPEIKPTSLALVPLDC